MLLVVKCKDEMSTQLVYCKDEVNTHLKLEGCTVPGSILILYAYYDTRRF